MDKKKKHETAIFAESFMMQKWGLADSEWEDLKKRLKKHENDDKVGWNAAKKLWFPHKSVEGGLKTIGFGLKAVNKNEEKMWEETGLSDDEMLEEFTKRLHLSAEQTRKKWEATCKSCELPTQVRSVLIELAFNLRTGAEGVFKFTSMISFLKSEKFTEAAEELLCGASRSMSSKYFEQTKGRAKYLSNLLRAANCWGMNEGDQAAANHAVCQLYTGKKEPTMVADLGTCEISDEVRKILMKYAVAKTGPWSDRFLYFIRQGNWKRAAEYCHHGETEKSLEDLGKKAQKQCCLAAKQEIKNFCPTCGASLKLDGSSDKVVKVENGIAKEQFPVWDYFTSLNWLSSGKDVSRSGASEKGNLIATKIKERVTTYGAYTGKCAAVVSKAIEDGLGVLLKRPESTKAADYGDALTGAGFSALDEQASYLNGDVVIFQPDVTDSAGHMQMYVDGHWYSDTQQPRFLPNTKRYKNVPYQIYRIN